MSPQAGSALQTTLPLLRLSTVLLRLSELIYLVDDKYLESTVGIELPIAGRPGDRASVVAKLVHFRRASLCKILPSYDPQVSA
jgi:hypothetical protein